MESNVRENEYETLGEMPGYEDQMFEESREKEYTRKSGAMFDWIASCLCDPE